MLVHVDFVSSTSFTPMPTMHFTMLSCVYVYYRLVCLL